MQKAKEMNLARQFPLIVHATHEAGVKVGGIGAMRDGLVGSPVYNREIGRTLLAGLLYGVRRFGQFEHEVLLVDASNPDLDKIGSFPLYVWRHYGIDSH